VIGSRPVTGRGFGGLQNYLLHGRNGASPDRAVWTSTRNLAINNPEQAAQVMRATASRAPRGTETPVYHLSVSLATGSSRTWGSSATRRSSPSMLTARSSTST
jgi:hypothetical protein